MINYDPDKDGIGLEQMNISLREQLEASFEHMHNFSEHLTSEDRRRLENLEKKVNLISNLLYQSLTDQVIQQEDIEALHTLILESDNDG